MLNGGNCIRYRKSVEFLDVFFIRSKVGMVLFHCCFESQAMKNHSYNYMMSLRCAGD